MAKALRDFARTNPNLVVKGGVLGTKPLTADEARALADVEPREVLLAKLAGALAAPMVQFAGLLEALPRNFAYGLKALIDQQGGVPRGSPRRACGGTRAEAACRRGRRAPRSPRPRPRPPLTTRPSPSEAPTERARGDDTTTEE